MRSPFRSAGTGNGRTGAQACGRFPSWRLAACGFIQAAEPLIAVEPAAMARIVECVTTGMGFIGGGAILQTRNSVKGTATAASLWVTGAIGVAVGLGSYGIAVVLSVITFVTLWALSDVKDKIAPDAGSAPADGE